MSETLDKFCSQNNLHNFEGRRGLEALCIIARGCGYKDPMYWGQLTSSAVVGDLIQMLEDNSGLIEAMLEWIGNTKVHCETLATGLEEESDEDDEE